MGGIFRINSAEKICVFFSTLGSGLLHCFVRVKRKASAGGDVEQA